MSKKPLCIPRELELQAAMFRLGKVDDEIAGGYELLRKYHKTVTIFGSARLPEKSPYYKQAREVGQRLAENNYTIITGGGQGIMEAGNRGAMDAKGDSIGFNIVLPHEQSLNDYTTDSFAFSHFSPRKIVMTMMADAYIYFPGGFGTLDELSEIITLTQTNKITRAPIILVGSDFWKPFNTFVKKSMLPQKLISDGDEKLYTITDDTEEIVQTVLKNQTYCDHEE